MGSSKRVVPARFAGAVCSVSMTFSGARTAEAAQELAR
jgi:hypothetical protein